MFSDSLISSDRQVEEGEQGTRQCMSYSRAWERCVHVPQRKP